MLNSCGTVRKYKKLTGTLFVAPIPMSELSQGLECTLTYH